MQRVVIIEDGTPESLNTAQWLISSLDRREYATDVASLRDGRLDLTPSGDDVVIPAGLSGFGNDGRLQGLLSSLGVRYANSGVLASALCSDKVKCKQILEQLLPVVHGEVFEVKDVTDQLIREIQHANESSFVLKPIRGASSERVCVVRYGGDSSVLENNGWIDPDEEVLVEDFLTGEEFTVAVLGDRELPPVLIEYDGDVYDRAAKYEGRSRRTVPAPRDTLLLEDLCEYAVTAGLLLGTRGAYRVDFRLDHLGRVFLIEVNSQPVLTDNSTLVLAARAPASLTKN